MPARHLPRTDDERSKALNACRAKASSITAPAEPLVTADQIAMLDALAPAWAGARDALGPLLRAQTAATAACNAQFAKTRRYVSHFFQVLNLAIDREEIPAEARAFYHLDVASGAVPAVNSAADLKLWAGRIAEGESKRVAAGGPPVTMPSAGQVAAALADFAAAAQAQTAAKTAYDLGQEAVAAQRPAVDALIRDLWATIEFELRNDAPPSLRRKAREWGVAYDDDAPDTATPAATPTASTKP